jgi:isovaleryl-CoA dehydrogenase
MSRNTSSPRFATLPRECGTQEQREQLTKGYTEAHNQELYERMAELGWLGVTIDEQYGGSGGSMLDACLFMIETSRRLAPIGGYGTTAIVGGAVKRFGTEEQKAKILGGIARGRVDAIAMTEPEAGWDVGSLTTARSGSTAASSSTGRRCSALTAASPTTSLSSPAPPRARTSTRA